MNAQQGLIAEMHKSEEQALVEQARFDPQAFAVLYDRYLKPVYRFALRRSGEHAVAEDITSATFEKALLHLRKYGWKGESYLAWLYRIAYQQMIQHFRRNHRFVSLPPEQIGEISVEGEAQGNLQRQVLLQAYLKLSSSDQEVLALRLFDGLSGAQVAVVLDCSVKNVYVRLHRALERLRRHLETFEEFEGEQ